MLLAILIGVTGVIWTAWKIVASLLTWLFAAASVSLQV